MKAKVVEEDTNKKMEREEKEIREERREGSIVRIMTIEAVEIS